MKRQMLALLLTAALLAVLLSACGDDAAETEEDGLASKYAYQVEYLDFQVDEAYQFQGVELYCLSGNTVFFSGACLTGGTETAVNEATGAPLIDPETGEPWVVKTSETAFFRLNLETGETVRLDYRLAEALELPEGILCTVYAAGMFAGLDGTFWVLENRNTYSYDLPEDFDAEHDQAANYYVPGESMAALCQCDADGQLLKTVDVSGVEGLNDAQILFDEAGNIYVNTTNHMIYLLDAGGSMLAELPNTTFAPLSQIDPGEIGAIVYDSAAGVYCFQEIDPTVRGYGEKITLLTSPCSLYCGIDPYRYLYEDSAGIVYGCGEDTGELEKLFSWLECDVDRNAIDSISFLENGDMAAVTKKVTITSQGEWVTETAAYGLLYLKQVDPSSLPQKKELTLACMHLDSDVQSAVLRFNQQHSDVRIVVRDYAVYNTSEDTTAGLTRLNVELLSGTVPDLICTSGLPVDQYAARGFLTDLWPLIDGDEELGREDLMTHLFDVMSIDGKLYQLTSGFSIWTAVGDAGVIGDRTGWTLEEMLEAVAALPEDSTILGPSCTKNEILSLCVGQNSNQFINWEDQTCSFDSPEFLALLNFANSFPEEYAGDASETVYERFLRGKQLLFGAIVAKFESMQWLSALVGGDPCYVGYPSSSGSGNAFYLYGGIAITTACQDPELAWSFLRTFLTEEYQTANINASYSYVFPTNRHAFEALVEQQMRRTGIPMSYTAGGVTVTYTPMTQEDYDTFMRLYESCGGVYTENSTVYTIIEQEAAPFFDGQKTAEEAAALIQNRVGLYVMEQK